MATVKLDPAKGVQIPNLTTTERNAISSPETGALIWNTTTSAINQYNGSAWEATDTNTQVAGITSSADATAITINSSEKVGIGTTSPQNKVHIATGDSSNNNFRTGTDTPLIIETAGSAAYIEFVADYGQPMGILMGDTSNSNDTASGGVTYDSNAGGLRLTSGGSHRLYAATNGNIGINSEDSPDAALHIGGSSGWIDIGAGNRAKVGFDSNHMYMGSTASAGNVIFKSGITSNGNPADSGTEIARIQSTGGISFNGDSAAANALDDYEKGTHECAITMGTGTATLHSSKRFLKYVKIGDQVTVSGQIQISAVSSPAGSFQISLPFTCSGDESDFSVGNYRSYSVDTPNDGVQAVIYSDRGTAKASLEWSRDGATSTQERATNGGYYMIGLTYFTT